MRQVLGVVGFFLLKCYYRINDLIILDLIKH